MPRFPTSYFPISFFPGSYFPPGAEEAAALVETGAFYAEPDRRFEKQLRELELDARLVKEQITDHIRAGEHAKPPDERNRPRFSFKAAERLDRHDTALLLSELRTIQAEIKSAKTKLREIAQEEDDMDVLLLLQ